MERGEEELCPLVPLFSLLLSEEEELGLEEEALLENCLALQSRDEVTGRTKKKQWLASDTMYWKDVFVV